MTKREALSLLCRYSEQGKAVPGHFSCKRQRRYEQRKVYLAAVLERLMRRIAASNRDPISEVGAFYYEMDDICMYTKSSISRRFACEVRGIAGDILEHLWVEEEADKRDEASYIYNIILKEE